jgi:hypothetical protein
MIQTGNVVLNKEDFPIHIEAVDEVTGNILWRQTVELPMTGEVMIHIPEPPPMYMGRVGIRMTYPDGRVYYEPPPAPGTVQ